MFVIIYAVHMLNTARLHTPRLSCQSRLINLTRGHPPLSAMSAAALLSHRIFLYSFASTLAVSATVLNALQSRSNFYSMAVYLSKSGASVLVAYTLLTLKRHHTCAPGSAWDTEREHPETIGVWSNQGLGLALESVDIWWTWQKASSIGGELADLGNKPVNPSQKSGESDRFGSNDFELDRIG